MVTRDSFVGGSWVWSTENGMEHFWQRDGEAGGGNILHFAAEAGDREISEMDLKMK